MTAPRLVVDIGGTNARFALADGGDPPYAVMRYATADFPSFADALAAYLAHSSRRPDLASCAIAAAGPVDHGRTRLTNANWTLDRNDIARQLNEIPVVLINDLEAVAAALPHLGNADCARVGGPQPERNAARSMLAFNVGTGCGAAFAVMCDGAWRTCPSEAGHMSLATDAASLAGLFTPGATVEMALSGNGVAELHAKLAGRAGADGAPRLDAAGIFASADDDKTARRTVAVLSELMGRVAGDLILAGAAWGGVFLTGSVARGWARVGDHAAFRHAFERKGAMSARMRGVPSFVIERDDVALLGLARIAIAAARRTP